MDILGVSPDGGRVLFDQDKGRIDLVNLADGQTAGQLGNVGPSAAFATLAVFGPDHSTPDEADALHHRDRRRRGRPEGRAPGVAGAARPAAAAAEIARLVTPDRVPVTCAAFSPHKDSRSWSSARRGRRPRLDPAERAGPQARGADHATSTATDPRYVTVRVEMGNKEFPLLDHSTATVIVRPGG